ncbi:hypothetical protein [Micromonospora pisi]|nr:hypothetical protein [Micromonospora pisi]
MRLIPARVGPTPRFPSTSTTTVWGALILAAAVVAWAYTVAVLTPRMSVVAGIAPMPGGDGELFMWVAELRWTAILLAALGMLTVVAGRRGAPVGALLLTGLLLGVDAALERTGVTGASGLAIALTSAAVSVCVAGWIAGRPGPDDRSLVVRRRLAVVAVVAACCAPLLLLQGTPTVNHPFLPVGLPTVTTVLPALLTMLAAVAVAAARVRALPTIAATGFAALPALLLAGFGATTGLGIGQHVTSYGALLVGPLFVVVVALLWWHPAGRRRGPVALWTALAAVGGALVTVPVVFAGLVFSMFGSSMLFTLAGTSYPADGVSVVPGVTVVTLVAGILIAARLPGPIDPPDPTPIVAGGPRPAGPPAPA